MHFLTRFSCSLFRKTLLLSRISLLKCFIYRRVNTSEILHGAAIPTMLDKNQVKTISVHFIKKELPSSQVIYCLPTRKIMLIQNISHACWKDVVTCSICHRGNIYRLVKRLLLYGNISSELSYINDYFQIPIFLIDEHCSR